MHGINVMHHGALIACRMLNVVKGSMQYVFPRVRVVRERVGGWPPDTRVMSRRTLQ